MYSPALGCFLQTDPIGYKDDLNWYAYVGNNPINRTDPGGMIASASGNFANASPAVANVVAQSSVGGGAKLDAPAMSMPTVSEKRGVTVSNDINIAATGRGGMYACDIISSECKGSVLREFPGQYLNSTLGQIQSDASNGNKDARKALKLLNDNRFKR
ncbi:protein of unknown function [Paraburkholderia kururiensis]